MRYIILSSLILTACVPAAIGGGAAAGSVGLKDKGFKGTFSDAKLSATLRNHLSAKDNEEGTKITRHIGIAIQNGEVLLTGALETEEEKMLAEKRIWEVKGVKNVINKIEVGQKISAKQTMIDSMLTTKTKTTILSLDQVRSMNYSVKTFDGIVYVMGISKSQDEQTQVLEAISRIKGVKKVVCLARFRDEIL